MSPAPFSGFGFAVAAAAVAVVVALAALAVLPFAGLSRVEPSLLHHAYMLLQTRRAIFFVSELNLRLFAKVLIVNPSNN